MSRNPKLLMISQHFPPELSASTVLVNNILKYYTGDLAAIAGFAYNRYVKGFIPPCETFYLKPFNNYFVKRIYYKLAPRLRFWNRAQMYRITKKIKPDIIFGNYPEIEFFVSSFEVAKKLNIPFYAYFHDLWAENMERSFDKKMAKKWEQKIVMESKRLICCTESQQEYYKLKYGRDSDLISHSIPDEEIFENYVLNRKYNEGEIAFVGSLSKPMNLDILKTISKTLLQFPPEFKLCWYPILPIDKNYLESIGFDLSRIDIQVIDTETMKERIKHSEFLLAPLSFRNGSKHEIETVFSNKLLIYLVSQRPILVVGPSYSNHAKCASKNGWGYVIDDDNADFLKKKIIELRGNIGTQEDLVRQAMHEARRRRSSDGASKLYKMVKTDSSLT